MERESNQQIAEMTLDLVECFISYLYVFRLRIHQLKQLSDPQPVEKDVQPDPVLEGPGVPLFEDAGKVDDADFHPPETANPAERLVQPVEEKPTEFQP